MTILIMHGVAFRLLCRVFIVVRYCCTVFSFPFRSIKDLFVQCASSVEHAFIGLLVAFLVYVLFYDWLFTEWSVYR